MTISWINVNPTWQLQDVQAGLTIVVAILSTIAIFSFVHFVWQRGTSKIRARDQASLASLLSINDIGEAWDVLLLLKLKLFQRKHWTILLQCVIVIVFTITALVSGPIARSAARRNAYQTTQDVTTWNVSRYFDLIAMASWDWTNIANRLDNASFPLNVLLDELPDVKVDWKYRPTEWNFTWSIECRSTAEQHITLMTTGQCGSLYSELPGLSQVLDTAQYGLKATDLRGFWTTSSPVYQHLLAFVGGTSRVTTDVRTGAATNLNLSVAAVHMTNAVKAGPNTKCWFAAAEKIPKSSYTRIDCNLTRSSDLSNLQKAAFPDTPDIAALIQAYNQMYQARFMREGATNSSITMIQPRDLQRFYQTYMISKDTQQRKGYRKRITAMVPITQISSAFVVCWSAIAAACLVVMFLSCRYYMRHIAPVAIPETKIEWMLQSIEMPEHEVEAILLTPTSGKRKIAPTRGKVQLGSALYDDKPDDHEARTPGSAGLRASTTAPGSATTDTFLFPVQHRSSTAGTAILAHDSASQFEDAVFLVNRGSKRFSQISQDTAYSRQRQGTYPKHATYKSPSVGTISAAATPDASSMNTFLDNFRSPNIAMPRPQRATWWGRISHSLVGSDGEDRAPLTPSTGRAAYAPTDTHDDMATGRVRSRLSEEIEFYERSGRSVGRDFV